MIVCGFLCNNIARMGLQNTTNMRDALMIVWGFLCSNIARMGLQNTTNTVHASNQHAFFVTILQGWVYKTQQTCEMHWWSPDVFFVIILQAVPKSPIPYLSSMPSNDVSCPYEHLSIGNFWLWLQGWVYNTQETREMHASNRASNHYDTRDLPGPTLSL